MDLSANNHYYYLFLQSLDDVHGSIVKITLCSNEIINLDLNDITTSLELVCINITPLYQKYLNTDVQIYIDNVTKILGIKEYKFTGEFGGKLFFVNKFITCNDVYFYDTYRVSNFKSRFEVKRLTQLVPAIIYCLHYRQLGDDEKFNGITTKQILPCTMFGEFHCDYDFYIGTKREYKTKAAIKYYQKLQ